MTRPPKTKERNKDDIEGGNGRKTKEKKEDLRIRKPFYFAVKEKKEDPFQQSETHTCMTFQTGE